MWTKISFFKELQRNDNDSATDAKKYVTVPGRQEAQLPQRNRASRNVSKFVLCFTSYGSYKGFKQQNSKSDLQGHSRASLAMVPFDRPHAISY